MSASGNPARRIVERKYREDLRRLTAYWPAEQITLSELGMGRLSIRLVGGLTHMFSEREASLLLSTVPRYMWGLYRVPLLLRYEKIGSIARYVVLGGRWQARLAEVMLRGDYSYRGRPELTVSEFTRIAGKYRSLVFVSLGFR